MKFKAIIFDMDGTIIETDHIWQQAVKDMITHRGIDLTHDVEQEIHAKTRGLHLEKSCALLIDLFDLKEDLKTLMKEKSHRANTLYPSHARMIEGFTNFHKKALDYSLQTGLATNADDDTLHVSKQTFDLEKYFGQHLYNLSHVNFRGKPEPDLFLYAADKLKMNPKECVVIEDSAHGVQAARDAGMFCIGINTSQNKALLKDSHEIIEHYDEIDLNKLLKK